MRHSLVRRSKWHLLLAGIGALAFAAAALGASVHRTAAPTLVVDNSFTLKTADPQRAFDPTGSIINRAIYDTLFTYKGSDLSNPIPLLVSSWKANKTDKVGARSTGKGAAIGASSSCSGRRSSGWASSAAPWPAPSITRTWASPMPTRRASPST